MREQMASFVRPDPDAATRMLRYDAQRKSVLVAYLLWLVVGAFGVHRFYLGSVGVGLLMLVCSVVSLSTFGLTGLIPLVIGTWDLFAIPGMVRRHNEALIASLAA